MYTIEGRFLRDGNEYIVQLDEGGYWYLGFDRKHLTMLGKRVRVEGQRSGFNKLDVRSMELVQKKPSEDPHGVF